MGMVQARCPGCHKLRRKAEPSKTKPEKRWLAIEKAVFEHIFEQSTENVHYVTICFVCAKKVS